VVERKELFPVVPTSILEDVDDEWKGVMLLPHALICVSDKHGRAIGVNLNLNRLIALTYYYVAVLAHELRKLNHELLLEEIKKSNEEEKIVRDLTRTVVYDNDAFAIANTEAEINKIKEIDKEIEELERKEHILDKVVGALDDTLEALREIMVDQGVEVDVPDTNYIFNP